MSHVSPYWKCFFSNNSINIKSFIINPDGVVNQIFIFPSINWKWYVFKLESWEYCSVIDSLFGFLVPLYCQSFSLKTFINYYELLVSFSFKFFVYTFELCFRKRMFFYPFWCSQFTNTTLLRYVLTSFIWIWIEKILSSLYKLNLIVCFREYFRKMLKLSSSSFCSFFSSWVFKRFWLDSCVIWGVLKFASICLALFGISLILVSGWLCLNQAIWYIIFTFFSSFVCLCIDFNRKLSMIKSI